MLIVQNDTGNRHSPTVIAAAITSQTGKAKLPTHIELAARQFGLPKDSVILLVLFWFLVFFFISMYYYLVLSFFLFSSSFFLYLLRCIFYYFIL